MAEHDEVPPGSGWTPIPDPTVLTSTLVEKAKDELRREIDFRLQILIQRFEALDKATLLLQDWRETLPRRLDDALKGHERVIDQRFQTIHGLFGTMDERFKSFAIQFANVQGQFELRDAQAKETAAAIKTAVDAALQAQEKAVGKQNEAFALSTQKSEDSFTKQIAALDNKIGLITEQTKGTMTREEVQQLFRGLSDKIDGPTGIAMRLEGMIARGVGTVEQQGRSTQQNQWIIGAILGGLAFLVALITLAIKIQSQ